MRKFFHSKYFHPCVVILTIGGSALFLFWPELSGKAIFGGLGLYSYMHFTVMKYFVYGLHILPNWWPAYSSGYPINLTLNGFLNPLSILTLKFLPPFLANNLLILFFFILNGLSFYAFVRALKLSRTGSLIAAISYAFSGAVMSWFSVITFTVTHPLLPLSFLCCLKIFEGKKRWFWLWLFLLVFTWIGGFAELMIYSIIAASCFCVYLIVKEKRKGNPVYQNATLFFGAVILSILLLSPWFLSVSHFVSSSGRSQAVDMENASVLPATFSSFIHMLYPRFNIFFGEKLPFIPLESSGTDYLYIGTLPLLLFLAALFTRQKKEKEHLVFFLCLTAGMLLLTIKYSPLFWIFHNLPILNKFRGLWKLPLITVFSLAIVAGYGFDNIKDFFRHRFSKYIINGLLILLCVAILGAGTLAVFKQKIISVMVSYGINNYRNVPDRFFARSNEYYQYLLNKMAESAIDNFSLKNKWVILTIILWSLALIHLVIGRKEILKPQTWKILAVIITWLGSVLIWAAYKELPYKEMPVSYLTQKPQTAEFLSSRNAYNSVQLPLDNVKSKIMEPYRISIYTPDQFIAIVSEKNKVDLIDAETKQWFIYEMMDYNINLAFNFDFFSSHEPLGLTRLGNLNELFTYGVPYETAVANPDKFNDYLKNFFTEKRFKMLGMANIKYVLSPLMPPDANNKFKPVFDAYTKDGIPVYIYQNPYFLPRWYFAKNIKWSKADDKIAFEGLKTINDFGETTLLEEMSLNDPAIVTVPSSGDKLELQLYTAGKLILKTNTKNYRFLVFSENRQPFWQAAISGNPVPLYTANYLYQAVLVPPGENTVEFIYPKLWEQGIISAQSYIQSFINKLAP